MIKGVTKLENDIRNLQREKKESIETINTLEMKKNISD